MRNARPTTLAILALCGAVTGCHVTGPASVETGRAAYNVAIQSTNNEQLLLNLVRLKYRDPPYFLEVSSVATSFDFGASASAGASLPESADKAYSLGVGASYAEKPTVAYTPLQGDKFVTQLMSPIDLNTILLLYHSGWSIERVFRICLQSMNGLKNAPSASGPTPDYLPRYQEFVKAAKLLRALQVRGVLDMGQVPSKDKEKTIVEMRLAKSALGSPEARELCRLLRLEEGRTSFQLTTEVGTGGKERICVVPRSLMASLFFVSQAVQVPTHDEQAGRVTVTRDPQGNRFDWQEVIGGLMKIHSSRERPRDAYVAVHYRGSWFYIDDSDLTGKSTFSLLMQLF
ncbi:MAG TPA: hypothetical protein VNA25_25765, partial [Phycisphaerae bacterium]|nr:hypothetical protein [Phycisphaerae bacterium]